MPRETGNDRVGRVQKDRAHPLTWCRCCVCDDASRCVNCCASRYAGLRVRRMPASAHTIHSYDSLAQFIDATIHRGPLHFSIIRHNPPHINKCCFGLQSSHTPLECSVSIQHQSKEIVRLCEIKESLLSVHPFWLF